ncbi:MAG: hypothetical protein ACREH6_05795 [Geminicoccaceae bacterium]
MRCRSLAGVALAFGLASMAPGALQAAPKDYPTEALADYVFGCMASNGETQDALRRCSCSIDAIAAKLPYDEYVQAETVMRMRRMPGGNDQAALFRGSPWAQTMIDKLREAQVEADLRCF